MERVWQEGEEERRAMMERCGQGEEGEESREVEAEGVCGEGDDWESKEEVWDLPPVVLSQETDIPMLPLQGGVHGQGSTLAQVKGLLLGGETDRVPFGCEIWWGGWAERCVGVEGVKQKRESGKEDGVESEEGRVDHVSPGEWCGEESREMVSGDEYDVEDSVRASQGSEHEAH
jgi:hypothetical protein